MTREEAIKVLLNEWECIDRNDGIHCDRQCEKCDLVMDSAILKDAYNMAIQALEQELTDAISRETVLSKIKEVCFSKEWTQFRVNNGSHGQRDFIIDYIEKLPSATQKSGKWIPVSERLPELKQRILVSYETMDDGKKVDITTYDKYGFLIGKAQAWMPLPEPYDPQESEEQTE